MKVVYIVVSICRHAGLDFDRVFPLNQQHLYIQLCYWFRIFRESHNLVDLLYLFLADSRKHASETIFFLVNSKSLCMMGISGKHIIVLKCTSSKSWAAVVAVFTTDVIPFHFLNIVSGSITLFLELLQIWLRKIKSIDLGDWGVNQDSKYSECLVESHHSRYDLTLQDYILEFLFTQHLLGFLASSYQVWHDFLCRPIR